jgi:hypothetical protein
MSLCAEDAKTDSAEQATIAPMTARSLDLQQQMRNISLPRVTERELDALARYTSTNAERLRAFDKKMPPVSALPLSELGRVNAGVGLQNPRS